MLAPSPQRLGDWLVSRHLISAEERDRALDTHKNSGTKLGHCLLASGDINFRDLYLGLSEQQGLPFVDLVRMPPEDALLSFDLHETYLEHQFVPWREENDRIMIASPNPKLAAQQADTLFDKPVYWVMCSPRDIKLSLEKTFAQEFATQARDALANNTPQRSAKTLMSVAQGKRLFAALGILALFFYAFPSSSLITFIIVADIFYITTLVFRTYLMAAGIGEHQWKHIYPSDAPPTQEDDLPIYSILVPMYREEATIPYLLNALRALDYPKGKLDIKLICEMDDAATINAIKSERPEPYFDLICVPHMPPRTKPKACNYAMPFITGDIVTIYDAEDRPDPAQLKRVVALFNESDDDVVCVQAKLNYYNRNENLLTQLFAIEYASLFDFMLPALEKWHLPIPLGGTSNHINTKRLRELGEWDPYNVTEDADLGIRCAMAGYRTRILNSLTLEEAPLSLRAWLNQRSRWIKGYMQTWLVYMRTPRTCLRSLGTKGFLSFQFFIGGACFAYLLSPLLWGVTALWALGTLESHIIPEWLLTANLVLLGAGLGLQVAHAGIVVTCHRWPGSVISILTYPFYWGLHSIASFKSFWQLLVNPHFWEKTMHGISRLRHQNHTI